MGVPALFRWLSQKYPKIISNVVEEQPQGVGDEQIPVDTTKANPNGEEMDNLYLDMNGIVHPCSHPEDKAPPSTEAEMMLEIFKYTDRVVNMVRPRRLLMIAVDGVAPRAKMNQQRARRFRSAQEAKEKDEEKAEFARLLKAQQIQRGEVLTEGAMDHLNKKTWDSNSITPGTPFMDMLAASLRYWVAYKLNTDPMWSNMKIIISDASVPGEGEHKIMQFVRSQRASQNHDPNTRHVIYGLDADLIMLGLATHEPHFRVLREDVFFQQSKGRACKICGQEGHRAEECRGEVKKKQGEFDEKSHIAQQKPFIWLHVSILREYLAIEMHPPNFPFKFDLERAIDDWVFMCFFVGNDFLPHLPSLDIREQGIDTLIQIWRQSLPQMGDYVTRDGSVDLASAQAILAGLAKQEDSIFRKRKEVEDRREARQKRDQSRDQAANSNKVTKRFKQDSAPVQFNEDQVTSLEHIKNIGRWDKNTTYQTPPKQNGGLTHDMVVNKMGSNEDANKSAAAVLKERLMAKKNGATSPSTPGSQPSDSSPTAQSEAAQTPSSVLGKRKADDVDQEAGTPGRDSPAPHPNGAHTGMPAQNPDEPPPDTVRLWEAGYADRYYEQKFKVDPKNIEFRHRVARDYVTGLCWVLRYYMQGCPSWTWYYPHHYAPFAADFVDLASLDIKFDKGTPFRPFEQLMGVLPAASNHAIPSVFHPLMTDPDSPIIDFYPEDFPLDLNGKKMAWQGVVILPFIDENRLLSEMHKRYPELTEDEARRNETGRDVLLFSEQHPLYDRAVSFFYSKKKKPSSDANPGLDLLPQESQQLAGRIDKHPDFFPQSELAFPGDEGAMPNLDVDRSMTVHYDVPISKNIHKSMLLRGAQLPPPVLGPEDINTTADRALNSGMNGNRGPRRGGGFNNNRGDRQNGGHHRGGYQNGNNHRGGYQNGPRPNDRPNPVAQQFPNFFPPGPNGAPMPFPFPPPGAAANGWMPPTPPGYPVPGMPPPFPPQGQGQGRKSHGQGRGGYQGGYQGGRRY
ncbi:MAG: hypothetical protein Q9159_007610 [Coniocarpon cinnabarinum]